MPDNEPTTLLSFISCALKTTGHYYRLMFIWGCAIAAICAVIYGVIIASSTLFPILISAATSISIWIYIPVGLITIPLLVAIVVCYVRRNEKEIEKADEGFICKE